MTFYDRLVGRGKAKKLALVAASRKLLTWAWAIFSTGAVWNPALPASRGRSDHNFRVPPP
jgi:hypothetical protein